MQRSPLEAENSAEVPLLSDGANDEDLDDDDKILSQLLSTNERSNSRRRRCCRYQTFGKWPFWASLFALLSWFGLFTSIWSTFSCDLVAVTYPTGGVQLSITAVGFWSYQKEVVEDSQKNNHGVDDGSKQTTKKVCVDYGARQQNMQVDLADFFPTNHTPKVYSILAPSFYFAGTIALFVSLLITLMHPEILTRSETEQYPATGIAPSITAAALLLINAGIFQVLSLHGLLHHSDNSESPICNPTFSQCHLGPGGRWAAFAIFTSFFGGLVACLTSYFVVCKTGWR